ncbi:MAG: isochorismatase family protein [Dehalococcoidales bacterium]|nr:isochorismatase family protein [Dehalococcoidales bacterium]
MLEVGNSVLVIIDIQEKLARVMHDRKKLIRSIEKLCTGMGILEVPAILTEQYPQGLGPTVTEVISAVKPENIISKTCFSCRSDDSFMTLLGKMGRTQLIVAGVEAHICVYQTVKDLVSSGYEVYVASDAVSSRTLENKTIGLHLMANAGALITSVETVLFELLKVAEGEKFRAISRLVK